MISFILLAPNCGLIWYYKEYFSFFLISKHCFYCGNIRLPPKARTRLSLVSNTPACIRKPTFRFVLAAIKCGASKLKITSHPTGNIGIILNVRMK